MTYIKNFTEFYNLIKHMNLQTVAPFDNFIYNVEKYKAACDCADHVARLEKRKISENQYVAIASGIFSQYVGRLKTPVELSCNDKVFRKY